MSVIRLLLPLIENYDRVQNPPVVSGTSVESFFGPFKKKDAEKMSQSNRVSCQQSPASESKA